MRAKAKKFTAIEIDEARLELEMPAGNHQASIKFSSDFIETIEGKLVIESYSTEGREKMGVIGKFTIIIADIEDAQKNGFSAFDVFDEYQKTFDYMAALYDMRGVNKRDPSFKKKVLEAINCEHFVLSSNLMIIDWVEIYPEFRGRNFANLAMETMIRKFGRGMEMIALCAMPLQFVDSRELDKHSSKDDVEWFKSRERLKLNEFSSDKKKSMQKLASHYGQIGFWRVTGTDYMVKAN